MTLSYTLGLASHFLFCAWFLWTLYTLPRNAPLRLAFTLSIALLVILTVVAAFVPGTFVEVAWLVLCVASLVLYFVSRSRSRS